ncbi:MAG: hypothetical protein ACO1SX_13595 [Actinomycetota bacterium]
MRAAPGSQLPVEQIFGRQSFVDRLWEVLENGSIRMEAERRIGKTSILQKMEAQPPAGWEPVLLDLEEVHSAGEFAEKVCRSVHQRLTGWKQQGQRLKGLMDQLGGSAVGPIVFPSRESQPKDYWKRLLTDAIEDLVEQQKAAGKRVVFFFDELPWMLTAISVRDGEQTAMEVLDVLRGLRQSTSTGAGFRMVLCGSIGLHHVLGALKRQGYRNQPVNDMVLIEVPPLELPIATELAARLLSADGLAADPEAPRIIAEQTGGFAFYVHWVVFELRMAGLVATPAAIETVVRKLLTAPHDPCDFRHFKQRVSGYYPQDETVALALLDHAAARPGPVAAAEMVNVAKAAGAADENRIRELLRLLAVDHYLFREMDGRYSFRHTLLRQWWVLEQGLVEQPEGDD